MRARPENRLVVALAALAAAAGVVLLALGSSFVLSLAGALLLGVAGIALVSLVFLLIGQGEEDDRTRRPRG